MGTKGVKTKGGSLALTGGLFLQAGGNHLVLEMEVRLGKRQR